MRSNHTLKTAATVYRAAISGARSFPANARYAHHMARPEKTAICMRLKKRHRAYSRLVIATFYRPPVGYDGGMDDPEDTAFGTIIGFNYTRRTSSVLGGDLESCVVRVDDGREVSAILDLSPRGKPCFKVHIRLGSRVRLDLGTVRDPIRIREILNSAVG
jgi:hypothetical protein